jgi:rhodanese-related sulfurtransferase
MDQFIEFISNHFIMSTAWLVLFILFVSSFMNGAGGAFKLINNSELTQLVNRQNAKVVDIRNVNDFNKGHITDSTHLALDKITGGQFGKLESCKNDPIVVVCNAGMSAKTAARLMHKAGFQQVAVLQGGIQSWLSANLPVVKK